MAEPNYWRLATQTILSGAAFLGGAYMVNSELASERASQRDKRALVAPVMEMGVTSNKLALGTALVASGLLGIIVLTHRFDNIPVDLGDANLPVDGLERLYAKVYCTEESRIRDVADRDPYQPSILNRPGLF